MNCLAWLALLVSAACAASASQENAPIPPEHASSSPAKSNPEAVKKEPAPGIRPYMPGVRIDWAEKEILLDSQVVLRQGPLELVACTPGTKEHESVLVVRARPLHIHQAMGLIGLEPGKPMRFDEKADTWRPPSGQRLDVLVRFDDGGTPREIRAEEWLLDVKTDKPPAAIPWVFAGSMTNDSGEFAADQEGTLITVVDFPTALIAPEVLHTSDDFQLWLRANTDAIPPLKSPCTIVIRAARGNAMPPDPAGVEKPAKPGDNPDPHGGNPDKDPG